MKNKEKVDDKLLLPIKNGMNFYRRIGLIIILIAFIFAFLEGITNYLDAEKMTFDLPFLIYLFAIIPLNKFAKLHKYYQNPIKENIPKKGLSGFKLPKTVLIITKIILGIVISAFILVGGIWFYLKKSTPFSKNYGILLEENSGWFTYQFSNEGFKVDFPNIPKSKSDTKDFKGKDLTTEDRTFSASDDKAIYQIHVKSLKDSVSGKLQSPTLEEIYNKYTILNSPEEVLIIKETENSIIYEAKDFNFYYSKNGIIIGDEYFYYLVTASKDKKATEEGFEHFFNSFQFLEQ